MITLGNREVVDRLHSVRLNTDHFISEDVARGTAMPLVGTRRCLRPRTLPDQADSLVEDGDSGRACGVGGGPAHRERGSSRTRAARSAVVAVLGVVDVFDGGRATRSQPGERGRPPAPRRSGAGGGVHQVPVAGPSGLVIVGQIVEEALYIGIARAVLIWPPDSDWVMTSGSGPSSRIDPARTKSTPFLTQL